MKLEDMIPAEAQELLIESGFSMNKEVIDPANCHDLIDLETELKYIYGENLSEHIAIIYNGERKDIYIAGDPVDITLDSSGKAELRVKNILLKGAQRTAVIKRMTEESAIVDTYTYSGWETYIFVWNSRVVQAGFMLSEYGPVSYLRIYKQRSNTPTAEEYYKVWKDKTRKSIPHQYRPVQDSHEIYGGQAASLGSIYTQRIHDELDDAIDFIASVKDDGEYARQLDILRDMLVGKQQEDNDGN